MNNTCPFCDSNQQYRYVTEGKLVRVIYPLAPGCSFHVLVTPKRHVATFDLLTNEEVSEAKSLIGQLANKVALAVPDFMGYNLLSNNGGAEVRQFVAHCHIHVFLRTAGEPGDPLTKPHSATPSGLSEAEMQDLKFLQRLFS